MTNRIIVSMVSSILKAFKQKYEKEKVKVSEHDQKFLKNHHKRNPYIRFYKFF